MLFEQVAPKVPGREGALTLGDRQLKQYCTEQVNNQLIDRGNVAGGESDGTKQSGKGKKWFSYDQEGHFSGDKKCPAIERACRKFALLLAISKLNAPGLVSVLVVTPDPGGIKVAQVLMVEEEILEVEEVTLEEDVVLVVEDRKKQTLWLTEITAKNLPDRFSLVPSLHFLWSS